MELRCTHIVVTGGSSGIGLAIAKRLAELGAEVVITGRRPDRLQAAQREIGLQCKGILTWDAADTTSIRKNLERAEEMLGGFDGLVNNAALSSEALGRGYEPWDITPEEWDKITGADLKGAFFTMREAVDKMRSAGTHGNILNICSNAACMDITGPYGVSKLSLLKLTRSLGKRFGSDGIVINGIAPGATATPMIAHYCSDVNAPYPRHALGRFIRPEEIAELAAYLMSKMGEIICGHTVVADAGDRAATL